MKKDIFDILCLILLMLALTGCSSFKKVDRDYELQQIMDNYLPPHTEVVFYTERGIMEKFGKQIGGRTECPGWPRVRVGCTIHATRNPLVLLHEICHVLEGGWHGRENYYGLVGCKAFSHETIARL